MEPTAAGVLAKTPLAHLIVYCVEKRLRGALVFRPEGDTEAANADVVTLVDGFPAKIRLADSIEHLGRVLLELGAIDEAAYNESLMAMSRGEGLQGQILIEMGKLDAGTLERGLRTQIGRKLGHVFSRPASTTYAYYDGQDFLGRYGGPELHPVDPFPTMWAGIRMHPSPQHVDATLERVVGQTMRLRDPNAVRFELSRSERSLLELLARAPVTVEQVIESAVADTRSTRLLVYALLISKQLELSGPKGQSMAPRGYSSIPSPARVEISQVVTSPAELARTSSAPAPSTPVSTPEGPATGLRAEILAKAKAIAKENYFEMLGLPRDAKEDDAKNAYFRLVKTWHPDRLPIELGDLKSEVGRVFALMAEAYQTLSDQDRRIKYLQVLKEGGGTPEEQAEVARAMEAAGAYQKADFLVGKAAFVDAEPLAKLAHELDPTVPDHVVLWYWVQANKPERREAGRYDDLIQLLGAVLADHPRHERARFYRASLLKMAGRISDAMRDFKEIVEANPKHTESVREVRLYTMRQDRDKKQKDEGAGSLFGRFMKKK